MRAGKSGGSRRPDLHRNMKLPRKPRREWTPPLTSGLVAIVSIVSSEQADSHRGRHARDATLSLGFLQRVQDTSVEIFIKIHGPG
jgi:hypothetical protein